MKSNLQRRKIIFGALIAAVAIGVPILLIAKSKHDYANIPAHRYVVPRWKHMGQSVRALVFSPDGKTLAVGASQGILYDVSIPDLRPQQLIDKLDWDTDFLSWSSDGQKLAIGNYSGVSVWDINRVALKRRFGEISPSPKFHLYSGIHIASPDVTLAAIGLHNGTITVWDTTTGKQRFKHERPTLPSNSETCRLIGLAFSPDNHRLAAAFLNGLWSAPVRTLNVIVYEADTGKTINTWDWKDVDMPPIEAESGNFSAIGLAFSHDGRTLASSNNSNAALWTIKTGYHIRTLHALKAMVYGTEQHVLFFPDGNRIAASGNASDIYIWNANSGRLIQKFHGAEFPQAMTVSPDGHWLATGGQEKKGDGTVSLWDVSRLQ